MDEKLIQRLESAVARLEGLSTGFRHGGAPVSGEDAVADPSILAFDDMTGQFLARVYSAAEKIGGQVLEGTKVLKEAFSVQRELLVKVKQTQVCTLVGISDEDEPYWANAFDYLVMIHNGYIIVLMWSGGMPRDISRGARNLAETVMDIKKKGVNVVDAMETLRTINNLKFKPDLAGLAEFLKPLNEVIMKANALTEGRRSDFFNHLKAAADSLSALAWIAFTGKDCGMSMPIAHVEESWQMAEFYNNKVLVEYRNKDPNHVEWAKAMKELYLPGLRDYVKSFYPLGPVWSVTGKKAAAAPPAPKASAPTTSARSAPAPPPPPPASLFSSDPSQASSSKPKEGMAAVFQEINSGKPATAGLKKVTVDMKTKNRADRVGVVGSSEKGGRTASPSFSKTGPPKLELQMGRKWVVENQIGRKNLVIDDCDAKQSVYIYGCKDSVLQIQGKVNNITVDKCTKMGVVFTDVVAAFEIVNSNGVEVQCQGSAPTISVDNTGGCLLYLSKDSLGTSITTAKSSEINVLVPGAGSDGDWVEHALPHQFVHAFKDGRFETTPVSHSGG